MEKDDNAHQIDDVSIYYSELSFGVLMLIAGRMMANTLQSVATDIDLSPPQLSVLGMIERYPDLPISSYGKILHIKEATLTRYVHALETIDLIERRTSKTDRRVAKVVPTSNGVKMVSRLRKRLEACSQLIEENYGQEALGSLSDDLRTFLTLCSDMAVQTPAEAQKS